MPHESDPTVQRAAPLSAEGDRSLIDLFVDGDSATFKTVDSWIRMELRRSYPRLRGEHDDLAQTVHGKLLSNLREHRFEGRSSFRSYVAGIVSFTAIDRLRELYRQNELATAIAEEGSTVASTPYAGSEPEDEPQLLRQILFGLPLECRSLWKLVYVDRLSYKRIAEKLEIAPGTVKSRMYKCRQKAMTALRRRRLAQARSRSKPASRAR